jgi:hypothetical protein
MKSLKTKTIVGLLCIFFFLVCFSHFETYAKETPKYYRGQNYSTTTYSNGTVLWASKPQAVWNSSNWVDYIFTNKYASDGYVHVQAPNVYVHASGNLGYELLDNNKVLRIWNAYDSYYFNVSSGIQFSNHYKEFWSHNIFLIGYFDGETWHKIYSADELSGFNKNVETDNSTYVNATLWKDLTYGGYDFRVALRYHLKTYDKNLTIQPYVKNLGKPISLVLGFAWKINDIKINNNVENDQITINGTSYLLNQTCDIIYKNMASASYCIEDITDKLRERLDLSWNKDLNYLVWVKSEASQYNAPVTLGIKVGTLDSNQEKTTIFYWHDATTENLFVDSLDSTYAEWSTSGTTPYLGDNGDYIYTDVNDERHGYFGFADMGGQVETLTSVTISCEAKALATGLKIDVYIYNGSWNFVGQLSSLTSSYDYYDIDISSLINTVAKINGCKAYFQADLSSAYDVYIRRAKLVVIYTPVSDSSPPTYSNVGTSTTDVRATCTFYVKWSDNIALSGYIFGTNNTETGTGTFQNDTWVAWSPAGTPKWSNVTHFLGSTIKLHTNVGARIEWCIWANDTSGNWNSTGIQYFITTGSGYWAPPSQTPSWHEPTGCDYVAAWSTEENAFNNNTADYASVVAPKNSWSAFLYLNYYYAFTCDKIRFYADFKEWYAGQFSRITVDVKCNGVWVNVFTSGEGGYSDESWVEETFSTGTVTGARVAFMIQDHDSTPMYLYEFQFWGWYGGNAPTNDALTLDLTGANYKGTKTLLTAKQDYKFVYKASDADGVTDITYAEIRLDYASKNVILRATRGTGDAWTFGEQSDPSNYVTLGTCSDSTSGTQKTFNFYVKINWAWGDSAETIGVRAYVIDSQSASDQDDYSNIFGVECHLASSSLSVNDYRVNPSQTLTMSGYWYYNGTAVIPPDGDYQVKIKLSGTQKGTTDTTLVSGAFSISDVTAESTVNSYTYQVFANYNASAGSFNAVVVDKARVYYEQLDDSRANINTNIEFRIKAILLYDNHALGTGDTVTANFGALTWDAGNNWFDGSRTQATVGSYVFQTSSLSEATYGITSFEINVTDPTGAWDRIKIDSIGVVDGRININTEGSFYATATLEFDSHTLGTGDSLSLSGHAFTWVSSRSRFEYNNTQSSVLHVTIDSFTSGSEATYGITVGNINSKSGTIIWDRIQVSFVANSTSPVLDEVVLFTVTLTREYDYSSITSYSYNINRNGSAFGNPHSTSTFTDVQSSQITYVYDFVSVVDNTYVLTAFVDLSNITVKWTSTNVAPTICDFSAPASVYAGQYIFINATVDDADGRTEIANATVQLSGNVILKWLNAFNTFSIQSDPNNYITLNQSACLRTILNDTAYLLSWNLKFAWNYSYTTPSIIVTNTKVYDMYSSYGSNSKSNLFAFKDDLIVATASVNPTETIPETNVVFSGTIYYYNTTMPPYEITGITVYLELDGLLQGATTTISSSGAWTKLIRCPATTGNKTYVVYVMTDEIGVTNKTVNLFVMSTGPQGGGYFFPSGPTYRPENYTYTPPVYVPEEVAVPTGLEGLGLNLLIIAIVGTTIVGVGASVVKPSRPTLASKMHVKRATNSDYQKRLRRPKRNVKH